MKSIFRIIFALAFALLGGFAASAQTPLTIDDFFSKENFGAPALSPSGHYIAMADYRYVHDKIIIVDLENDYQTTSVPLQNYDIGWVGWASEDRIVLDVRTEKEVYLTSVSNGKKRRVIKTIQFVHLLAMGNDGSDQKIMFANPGKKLAEHNVNFAHIVNFLPSDPDHILMRASEKHMTLWKVNLYTGEASIYETGGPKTFNWTTNHEGLPYVRYDYTNRRRYVEVKLRVPGEKKWYKLAYVKREDLNTVSPIAPTSSPHKIYVRARPNDSDKFATYIYDMSAKTYSSAVSSHKNLDIYETLTDGNGDYFASVYFDDKVHYDFNDTSYNADIKALNNFFKNAKNIWIEDISVNGQTWLLRVESPQEPGSYYTYDTKEKRTHYLTELRTYPVPEELSPTKIITYQTRDGLTLKGYFTRPIGASAATPLIVFPHGGPEARDYFQYDVTAQFLASRGYQVFQPNFRGSSGFGHAFAKAGYGEWGLKMQDDLTDGVNHLTTKGLTSKDNICIMGMSYGGYAALVSAYKSPAIYKCAVSINGASNLLALLDQDKTTFGKTSFVYAYMKETIGNPNKDAKKIKNASPYHNIADIEIPILLIHGNEDQRISVNQSRSMFVALEEASKTAKYVELLGTNHNLKGLDPDDDDAEDLNYAYKKALLKTADFFDKYLAP